MHKVMRGYIRAVDAVNYRLGRLVMYGIFVMVAILLWSSLSKTFFTPTLWTLEMAQFAMVAYYMLGGPYALQMGANVRMDLFYHTWDDRRKAWFDAFTVLFLLFFLGVLLWGALSSTAYALGYFGRDPLAFYGDLVWSFVTGGLAGASEVLGRFERSPTAWRPYMWPIKVLMTLGIFLMLLQAMSEFFKDVLRLRGEAA
ncbi:MAG: TRAP transporter small permease subunit [Paracoccaceae bacterium]|jgi:TRAP-type mannitol/chloroaromatic compound transport system permease small subunit|uniref:TRAP transporter small permease subunit n=1 Tax=Seohaeicola saemankumensis TaxID=481181 RepID=UPI001E2845EC|nr:TRAP transporter small permease subunit [Seohaeicola saemankumensis]MCD1626600.1 TRAP transporter small permease subunit [Seohaeicola saemankumensis]